MTIKRIAVLGLGKVGHLAAELLQEAGFEVIGVDQRPYSGDGTFGTKQFDLAQAKEIFDGLDGMEAVLSCLPYHLNIQIAEIAHQKKLFYFDLTEDVPTTQRIIELSKSAERTMAPQCGLAPGLVGIVAADLAKKFDKCRSLRLRVGALPRNPTGLLGYAFNWSPVGVVNEYLNDCEVIEEGVRKMVSPMEWKETIFVNGVELEAFTTSGGLGTMCETFLDEIDNIDYKTIRYPGHVDLMNFFFHELLMREHREQAGIILTNAKPPVDDDVVHIHVAAEGESDAGLRRDEFVRSYMPRILAGKKRTAIAWTTAASVTAVIEMVSNGSLADKGFIKQEEIPFDEYCGTTTGALFVDPKEA